MMKHLNADKLIKTVFLGLSILYFSLLLFKAVHQSSFHSSKCSQITLPISKEWAFKDVLKQANRQIDN